MAASVASLALIVSLAACGSKERQDENETAGDFEVEVTQAKFPTRQQLAETSDLELTIGNSDTEDIENLVITVYTGDTQADGSFNERVEQEGLADPNRPVWILENEFPKCVVADDGTAGEGCATETDLLTTPLEEQATAGAETASSNTYSFGPLPAGEELTAIWQVTPVKGGNFTVHYEVAAGLDGKAKAVSADGSPVMGEFAVNISTEPPATRVNDAGKVVPADGPTD